MTSLIIGLLVIAAVWSVYLLPLVFGERRNAPITSTQEFDRWSHSLSYVQRQTPQDMVASRRDMTQRRRLRVMTALVALTLGVLGIAWYRNSMAWLLTGLFFGSLLGMYLVLLAQMKQQRLRRIERTHVAERHAERDEPQVRVIAN